MKILVIEDDAIIKNTTLDILKEENFQTIDASNGIVGLKLAQEYLPDLILCDVKMPNVDGYEVLKTLKNNHLTSCIPFIFLTSKTNRSSWRKGMELGADDYITKPFTPKELLKAIATRSQKNPALGSYSQIDRAEKVAQARSILNFDRLTNLPSRLLFQEKFEEFVKNHLLANISSFAQPKLNIPVLCLKISNFSQLNYDSGTDILKTVAESLQTAIFNRGIVTYLDTGIFAIVLPSIDRRKDLLPLINKLYQNICDKLNSATTLDMWVGVSFYPQYANSLPKSIEQARSAMKPFKTENTWRSWFENRSYFFHPHRQRQSNFDRLVIRKNLPQALALKEFKVKYQPQVCVNGKITACKAILNWQHPIHGNIEPKNFIPVAEATGAIASLNIWLLDRACQQLKYWQQQGFSQLKLIVSASESHFYQETFNLDLFKVIKKHQLYNSIVLEIEENILLQNPQQAQTQLDGLHNLGIEIILAGFATGYTNLEYWQFPFDGLTLDWQRLGQIYDSDRIKQIVNATITLAHYRNIKAIATGFNRDRDWQFITQQEFDLALDASDTSVTALEFTQLLTDKKLSE